MFLQGTASEATLVALLGAKARTLQIMKESNSELVDKDVVPKLVAYSSELSHSSVERAGLLGGVLLRALNTDGQHKLRGDTLRDAIAKDRENGLVPFFVVATLGTTSCCSFDRLDEIAEVGRAENIWVHVDAAYAGTLPYIYMHVKYIFTSVHSRSKRGEGGKKCLKNLINSYNNIIFNYFQR